MAVCTAAAKVGGEVGGYLTLPRPPLQLGTPADPGFSPAQYQGQAAREETSGRLSLSLAIGPHQFSSRDRQSPAMMRILVTRCLNHQWLPLTMRGTPDTVPSAGWLQLAFPGNCFP